MKIISKKQLRLLLSDNYMLVLFLSSSECKILYEGEIEKFSYEEIVKRFYNHPVYIFIDNIDTNFSTVNSKNLALWHIAQLKKRIMKETTDSVVSILKKSHELHIAATRISPLQLRLMEKFQSFCIHPINVSILASNLPSLSPQTPSISLQYRNGAKKIFVYENDVPKAIKIANESKEHAVLSVEALEKISFTNNHLTYTLPGRKEARYLQWVKHGIWFCVVLFLTLVVINIVPQIKKYNDAYHFDVKGTALRRELSAIPEVAEKKRELNSTLLKLAELESLEKKNIHPVFLFKKLAVILPPSKVVSAEFHVDENAIFHLNFLLNGQGLSNKILTRLQEIFPQPIEVKLERKASSDPLLKIFGEPPLFKKLFETPKNPEPR